MRGESTVYPGEVHLTVHAEFLQDHSTLPAGAGREAPGPTAVRRDPRDLAHPRYSSQTRLTQVVSQTFANSCDSATVIATFQDVCVHEVTVTNHKFSSYGSFLSPGLWCTCMKSLYLLLYLKTVRIFDLWSVSWHVCIPQMPPCTPLCLRPTRMRVSTLPTCPPTWDTDARWWMESFMCTQRRAWWTCERLFTVSQNCKILNAWGLIQLRGYVSSHTYVWFQHAILTLWHISIHQEHRAGPPVSRSARVHCRHECYDGPYYQWSSVSTCDLQLTSVMLKVASWVLPSSYHQINSTPEDVTYSHMQCLTFCP